MTTEEQPETEEKETENNEEGFKVSKVRVFLTQNPKVKGESIIAAQTQAGMIPLVALDDKQYKAFTEMAQDISNESGMKIWVAEFGSRIEGEVFERQLVCSAAGRGPSGPPGPPGPSGPVGGIPIIGQGKVKLGD